MSGGFGLVDFFPRLHAGAAAASKPKNSAGLSLLRTRVVSVMAISRSGREEHQVFLSIGLKIW